MNELRLPTNHGLEKAVIGSAIGNARWRPALFAGLSDSQIDSQTVRDFYLRLKAMEAAGEDVSPTTFRMALYAEGADPEVLLAFDDCITTGTVGRDMEDLCAQLRQMDSARSAIRITERASQRMGASPLQAEEIIGAASTALNQLLAGASQGEREIGSTWDEIATLYDQSAPGVRFPYDKLNNYLGGKLPAGELMVLCARPGVGKTAWAINAMLDMAGWHKRSAFYSLEMGIAQVLRRMVQKHSRADLDRLEDMLSDRADLGDFDEKLGRIRIREVTRTISAIHADVAGMAVPPSVIWIDHLGLIKSEGKSRYEQVSNSIVEAKWMAKKLRIPVVMLAQLSRVPREDKPRLSDLRDSGRIEEDADHVIGLSSPHWREEEQAMTAWEKAGGDRPNSGLAVSVLKAKHGRTGDMVAAFDKVTQRIWEADEFEGPRLIPEMFQQPEGG